jgi:hypothetical protein
MVEVLEKEITSTQTGDPNISFADKIIFSYSDGNISSIYICNSDGSDPVKLIEGGIFASPSRNTEYTKIVLTSTIPENGVSGLYTYDVKSKNMNLLL